MKTCPVCDAGFSDEHSRCPTHGAVLIEVSELAPGHLVRGKYRIVQKVGHGGMGIVYLAEHLLLGRPSALKFLTGELSRDPNFIRRFRNEARAACTLRDPNIVEVTDLDQAENGDLYIAMEYIEGPSLRSVIQETRGQIPVPRALAITRGIASGLAAAHDQGTVHRDIKPENILLAHTSEGREKPKILDFGIASMVEGFTAMSRTRGLILTPEYAAPEQWRGVPGVELTGATDLYALGGVLYELLTGRPAFRAQTAEGWMYQHLHENPIAPSRFRPEVAAWSGLDDLVLSLLAKDRGERLSSAKRLVDRLDSMEQVRIGGVGPGRDLADFQSSTPLPSSCQLAPPESSPPVGKGHNLVAFGGVTPVASPHRRTHVLVLAAIVTLIGVGSVLLWNARSRGTEPERPLNDATKPQTPNTLNQTQPTVETNSAIAIFEEADASYNAKDYVTAASQYATACKDGYARACTSLGFLYRDGRGVPQSTAKAKNVAQVACTNGDQAGCELLKSLQSENRSDSQAQISTRSNNELRQSTANQNQGVNQSAPSVQADQQTRNPQGGHQSTAFSLRFEDLKIGTGAEAEPMKMYSVKYKGWRAVDGVVFDSWDQHPKAILDKDGKPVLGDDGKPKMGPPEPANFPVGMGRLIPGFDQGFAGMRVGGIRRIYVPWQLAYGTREIPAKGPEHPGIPPKSDLVFEVELLGMSDLPPNNSATSTAQSATTPQPKQ